MARKPDDQKEKSSLLSHFLSSIRAESFYPLEKHTALLINVALEVLVVSVDPKFVVTDGEHKVPCEISKEAILKLKRSYPNIKLKDLDKRTISLIRFAPHTKVDANNHLILTLHIYEFKYHENEKEQKIPPKLKDLAKDEEIANRFWLIEYKDLRRFVNNSGDPEKVPSLEKVILKVATSEPIDTILKYKPTKAQIDELGKAIVPYEKLDDDEEDKLRDEATNTAAKEKERVKKEKEIARRIAKEMKQKPRNLQKQLLDYAVNEAIKSAKESDDTNLKENVTEFIKKSLQEYNQNERLKSASKASIKKSTVSKKDLIPRQANPSEMKFTKKGFKDFINWRHKTGDLSKDATNVADILKNSKTGGMQIGFIAPEKPIRKAFEGMVSTMTPDKKRIRPEASISANPSVSKRFKP